jgi:hypothetical protein
MSTSQGGYGFLIGKSGEKSKSLSKQEGLMKIT